MQHAAPRAGQVAKKVYGHYAAFLSPRFKRMSLAKLALASDISESHLSLVLRGRRNLSISAARRLARVAQLDWAVLVERIENHVRQTNGRQTNGKQAKTRKGKK